MELSSMLGACSSFALAFSLICQSGIASAAVVVPGENELIEGGSQNNLPFKDYNGRYQQVYASSEFGSDPLSISAIAFRINDLSSGFLDTTFTNMTVNLSTSANTAGSLSSTFADNIGTDAQNVYSGDLILSGTGGAGPNPFDVTITFQTAFVYNPAGGDLLLEIFNPNNISLQEGTAFDAVSDSNVMQRVYDLEGGVSSESGTTDDLNFGLVTQFETTTVVPLPAALPLFGAGLLGLIGISRRKKAA